MTSKDSWGQHICCCGVLGFPWDCVVALPSADAVIGNKGQCNLRLDSHTTLKNGAQATSSSRIN